VCPRENACAGIRAQTAANSRLPGVWRLAPATRGPAERPGRPAPGDGSAFAIPSVGSLLAGTSGAAIEARGDRSGSATTHWQNEGRAIASRRIAYAIRRAAYPSAPQQRRIAAKRRLATL
jgi:hypothetical protein